MIGFLEESIGTFDVTNPMFNFWRTQMLVFFVESAGTFDFTNLQLERLMLQTLCSMFRGSRLWFSSRISRQSVQHNFQTDKG